MSKNAPPPVRRNEVASLDCYSEFIAAQLARQKDEVADENDVIVHADCGFGESS